MSIAQRTPDFDRIARAYRWMEYLTLGRALERTRFLHLDAGLLDSCREALVLGDGDGRFTNRLLRRNPQARITAVDASESMLRLLTRRSAEFRSRLEVIHVDARDFVPRPGHDLVASHFFLDCLTETEVQALVSRVRVGLEPGATWVISEFRATGWLSTSIVSGLYLAFRLMTGLQIKHVPDYASALKQNGFELKVHAARLGGLLETELWMLPAGALRDDIVQSVAKSF